MIYATPHRKNLPVFSFDTDEQDAMEQFMDMVLPGEEYSPSEKPYSDKVAGKRSIVVVLVNRRPRYNFKIRGTV